MRWMYRPCCRPTRHWYLVGSRQVSRRGAGLDLLVGSVCLRKPFRDAFVSGPPSARSCCCDTTCRTLIIR